MRDVVQLLVGQLRHEFLRAALAAEHVRKGNVRPVGVQLGRDLRKDLRLDVLALHRHVLQRDLAVAVDEPLEHRLGLDRHVLVQLLHCLQLLQLKLQHARRVAHVLAHFHAVDARLQHEAALVPRSARVVVGRELL